MMSKTKLVAMAAFAALSTGATLNAATIAAWDFEGIGDTPAASGIAASTGTGSAGTNSGGTLSSPAGFGSTDSYSSNGWSAGEYFEFTTSSLGYESIELGFAHTGSNTGPANFAVQYSTDGTTFTQLGTYTVTNDSWDTNVTPAASVKGSFLFPEALDNDASIYFRLAVVGTTSINGGTIASTGTSRVDSVVISGTSAVPEPTTFGLLGAAGLMALRRRRA
jgi:hypothetical protein